jgi:Tfp pilus assembly protein PilN
MIKINLALRKGPSQGVATSGGRSGSLFSFLDGFLQGSSSKAQGSSSSAPSRELVREVVTRLLVVACVYLGTDFFVGTLKDTELEKVRSESGALQNEIAKLNAEVAKRAELEADKKKIEEFEKVLKAKLETIERLMVGRDSASKIFRELSGIIPPEVWLNSINVEEKKVTFRGSSLGIDPITTFLAAVNASPYYQDGQPQISEKAESDRSQVTQSFEVTAGRRGVYEP